MREWYLIGSKTKPNMLGGYENQAFDDFKDDAFLETLETDMADDIILYNYDLSESKEIRAIVQDNVADTQLKSMERTVLVPIGTLHSGDYIFFEDEYWIVDGRPGNNKIYEKATVKECQYLLKWQNANGDIIERWINLTSASKYDVGETGNKTMILTSNNLAIVIPNDKESFDLDGKRVFIDLHPTNPTRVFKLTRTDDVLFNHNSHGGTLSLIADKTELNKETDNTELRICNYITTSSAPSNDDSENPKQSPICLKINYAGSPIVKVGGSYKTFKGIITDSDGNSLSDIGMWNINCDFAEKLTMAISDNQIKIKISDSYEELVGRNFELVFKDPDNIVSDKIIVEIESYV